jgi:hypothetical protein
VDRGALDAALAADFPCGGWCPGDRMAEDGVIPDRYPLMPLPNGGYRARTRLNVVDSDGYSSTGRAVRISYPRPAPASQRRDSDSPHGLASVAASMRQYLLYKTLSGGTRLTRNLCALLKRPYVLVDARQMSESEGVAAVREFVEKNGIQTLNVAGPRLSGWAAGYAFSLAVIKQVIVRELEQNGS